MCQPALKPSALLQAALYCALASLSLIASGCTPSKPSTRCAANGDCSGSTTVCDPASGACVECLGDSNCPLGSVCAQGACVAGCSADHACQAGTECCASQCFTTTNDVQHCGGCNACPAPATAHAEAVCNNGSCGFGPCATGFADCNNERVDGCETDLQGAAGCPCTPGELADCYDGPVGTLGHGPCAGGQKTCRPSGIGYGPCAGQVLPAAESCLDGVDNDCNGQVNEGGTGCLCAPGATASCYGGPTGTQGVGPCVAGLKTCNAFGTAWERCVGEVTPQTESCADAVDNDCNGQVNEAGAGCVCLPRSTATCYGGPTGTQGVGPCVAGLKTCNAFGTAWEPCVGELTPQAETCLDALDNDCNGQANEGGAGCACLPNSTASCYGGPTSTEGVGTCLAGLKTCNPLGTAWQACVGEVIPQMDSCLTSLDEDCSGSALTCAGNTVCHGSGACLDVCDPRVLGQSSVGCEYYPTVTSNSMLTDPATLHFAVSISNPGDVAVNYQVFNGTTSVSSGTADAGSVATVLLPWIPELRVPGSTLKSTNAAGNGAYRLQTDRPVAVFQFNPLEATYTNDASLLIPTHVWSSQYVVAARNTFSTYSGFYAVTASQNATTVTLTPGPTGAIVKANLPLGVNANGTGTVTLDKGDVLQVLSAGGGGTPDVSDLTGTRISADKPVQVIGGHDCSNVPWNFGYCDHLEESVFPLETLAKRYLITAPLITASTARNQLVRIISTAANTALTFDPPQVGAPTVLAQAGQYFEFAPALDSYLVTADQRLIIAQYILGATAPPAAPTDPSMTLAVGVPQYRTSYLFHAPTNYTACFVNITAPAGATVTLDGTAVAANAFVAIGGSGFSVARLPLSNAGTGTHTLSASAPVGLSVYGYGATTSFWYPGGLDLTPLAP